MSQLEDTYGTFQSLRIFMFVEYYTRQQRKSYWGTITYVYFGPWMMIDFLILIILFFIFRIISVAIYSFPYELFNIYLKNEQKVI